MNFLRPNYSFADIQHNNIHAHVILLKCHSVFRHFVVIRFLLKMCVYPICRDTLFFSSFNHCRFMQMSLKVLGWWNAYWSLLGGHFILWRSRCCELLPYGGLTLCVYGCVCVSESLKSSSLEDYWSGVIMFSVRLCGSVLSFCWLSSEYCVSRLNQGSIISP